MLYLSLQGSEQGENVLIGDTDMKKTETFSGIITILLTIGFFSLFAIPMGLANAMNTMMNTAYALLIDTCFYIMAIAVIAGAFGAVMSEFGVVKILNRILSVFMKPLFGLPGAAALGIVTTYLSDNPAILALAKDRKFVQYFKEYQIPALTNLGTSFGMGMMVTTFMLGLGSYTGLSMGKVVLCGNLGAVFGCIISTRLMIHHTSKAIGTEQEVVVDSTAAEEETEDNTPKQGVGLRLMNALLDGGQSGVELGMGIIPAVLVICTVIMMLTKGPGASGYTGDAYQGIALLPMIANKANFILQPLFGFSSPECISVPITAMGSTGATFAIIRELVTTGLAKGSDIAVFTAICMCWSGYLSTHVSMMQALNHSELSGKSILFHTIGGICAGVFAHYLYLFLI